MWRIRPNIPLTGVVLFFASILGYRLVGGPGILIAFVLVWSGAIWLNRRKSQAAEKAKFQARLELSLEQAELLKPISEHDRKPPGSR